MAHQFNLFDSFQILSPVLENLIHLLLELVKGAKLQDASNGVSHPAFSDMDPEIFITGVQTQQKILTFFITPGSR